MVKFRYHPAKDYFVLHSTFTPSNCFKVRYKLLISAISLFLILSYISTKNCRIFCANTREHVVANNYNIRHQKNKPDDKLSQSHINGGIVSVGTKSASPAVVEINKYLEHPKIYCDPIKAGKERGNQWHRRTNYSYLSIDFKFALPEIAPKFKTRPKIFMIVLVNSGAKGDVFRKRRAVIRQTWGNQSSCEQRKALRNNKLKHLRWLLVFVVAKAGKGTEDDKLNMAEARENNDMLIGNITDNYLNIVVKLFMGKIWASRFNVDYIMKTDDDVYVRIPRVLEFLANKKFPRPFYGGKTYPSLPVNRQAGHKWAISKLVYAEEKYPRFNSGAFIVLSKDVILRLINNVCKRKPFQSDDAYVGLAMRDLGVKPTHIASFILRRGIVINEIIQKGEDCELIKMHAFGHKIKPDMIIFLHNRLETLICTNVGTKYC